MIKFFKGTEKLIWTYACGGVHKMYEVQQGEGVKHLIFWIR